MNDGMPEKACMPDNVSTPVIDSSFYHSKIRHQWIQASPLI